MGLNKSNKCLLNFRPILTTSVQNGAIRKDLFKKHYIPEDMAGWMAKTANMALAKNTE